MNAPRLPREVLDAVAGDPFTAEWVGNRGPSSLNPLLGFTSADTFGNIEKVMGVLMDVTDPDRDIDLDEAKGGVHVLIECVRVAAEYERDRLQHERRAAS